MNFFVREDLLKAYTLLGLEYGSDEKEVKDAYRKAALRYHPDKNQGSKDSEERFKEVSSAYDLLVQHFEFSKQNKANPFSNQYSFFQYDLRIGLSISLSEAYSGSEREVRYWRTTVKKGSIRKEESVATVKIPPKVKIGQVIVVKGAGNVREEKSGDLHLFVTYPTVEDNCSVTPSGALFVRVSVPWVKGLVGETVKVTACRTEFEIRLNAENSDGHIYQVAGGGFVSISPALIQVFYELPKNIKAEDRAGLVGILQKYVSGDQKNDKRRTDQISV